MEKEVLIQDPDGYLLRFSETQLEKKNPQRHKVMNTMKVSSKKHYRTIVITTALILCLFLSACAPIPRKDQPLVGRWRESPNQSMTFYASGAFIEEKHCMYKFGTYTVDGDIFTTVVDGETKSYKYYFRTDGGMHVERYYEDYPDLVGGLGYVYYRKLF